MRVSVIVHIFTAALESSLCRLKPNVVTAIARSN